MFIGIFDFLSNIIFQTGMVDSSGTFPSPLSKEKERELVAKKLNGDEKARELLIKHNMRLVIHVVKKYNNYYDSDELISVGSIGLMKAVDTYSNDRGTGLATYAVRCIENEILMTLRANKKRQNDRSLYEPLSYDKEGNEITLIDLLATDEDEVTEKVERQIFNEKIMKIIDKLLDDREKQILMLRYGLDGGGVYTQIEISKKLDISRSYVSRIEKKALGKLKSYLLNNKLI